jgi:beta-lactamase class A
MIYSAVERFVGDDPGRSVALRTVRGPYIAMDINGNVPRPAASILKIPLALAVLDAIQRKQLSESTLHIQDLPQTEYRTIVAAFENLHKLTVKEACSLMLLTSDNPLAEHLLGLVGFDAVNDQARRLGAIDTTLSAGFSDEELGKIGRQNISTANDSLQMIIAATLPGQPSYEIVARALRNSLRNTRIPLRLPDDVSIAHKTGTLRHVANDVGMIFGHSTDLAIAFLSDNQEDTARVSMEIGDCVAEIWQALGEAING